MAVPVNDVAVGLAESGAYVILTSTLAGIAGIAQTLNPFADPGAGAAAVKATKEALTFKPRTEKGQAGLQAVGEALNANGGCRIPMFQNAHDAIVVIAVLKINRAIERVFVGK